MTVDHLSLFLALNQVLEFWDPTHARPSMIVPTNRQQ